MKLCVECIHFHPDPLGDKCARKTIESPVTGLTRWGSCAVERQDVGIELPHYCGPEGQFWQLREERAA